jgi:predicted amidophosphoribosyltransferase
MTTNPNRRLRGVADKRHGSADNVRDSRAANTIAGLPADYLLPFATCFVYSPKGESGVSQLSRQLCARVKSGSARWLKSYATTVHQEVFHGPVFREFFAEQALLVPIPEYRPSGQTTFWAARRLALALQHTGLAEEVWTGLHRISSVERSSSAWMWERPTVQQHYQSFAVTPSTKAANNILLVDDVITKGRTLAAAAMRIQEAFPKADVRAFALVRTMGFVLDVPRLFEPCRGVIHWNGEDAYRAP